MLTFRDEEGEPGKESWTPRKDSVSRRSILYCANAAERLNKMTETDLWMCQQEVIDDSEECSFNGVAETKAWLELATREWG